MSEYGREIDNKTVVLSSGHHVEGSKLVCPECGTMDARTSIQPPADPRLEFEAKCPRGHTWRFYVDAR